VKERFSELRVCSKCRRTLPIDSFPRGRSRNEGGRDSRCGECRRAYQAEWRVRSVAPSNTKRHGAAYMRAWRAAHLERSREYGRKWYAKNRSKRYASCRRWRLKNRARNEQYMRAARAKRRAFVAELKNRPCTDCGHKFPSCAMDFDHVRGEKSFQISSCRNAEVTLREAEKCEVVCANCHRVRTQHRRTARHAA